MRLTIIILSALIWAGLGFVGNTVQAQAKVKKIIIDAGHGGKDPGCLGAHGLREKDIVLKVALKLGKYLKDDMGDQVEIIYTRDKDVFIPLYERSEIANKANADLFLSLHCNANNKHSVYGTETYVMGLHTSDENLEVAMRENSVILQEEDYSTKYQGFDPKNPLSYIMMANMQYGYLGNSLLIADLIEKQFANRVKRKSRGVKQAGYVVLRRSAMPSVLIEMGFLSNPNEANFLKTENGQSYIASGIFRAIKQYFNEIEGK